MLTHLVKNGFVVNTIVASVAEAAAAFGSYDCVDASMGGAIGDSWDGETFASNALTMLTIDEYTAAIQAMLDAKAQERRYDSILSACTYVSSTVTAFAAEGQACINWRDAVWSQSYAIMAQVTSGTLPQPTIPQLLEMLPAMDWPL